MNKSILALLLALCMVLGLLAGCGSAGSSSAPADEASVSAASEAEESAAEESEAAEEPASAEEPEASEEAPEDSAEAPEDAESASSEEAAEPVALAPYEPNEESAEVSVLFQYPGFFQGFFPEGWNASPWWETFGEKTNTTWTLREVSNMAWQENVSLLCASGDLPDVVTNIGAAYNGGVSAALRDEMIIDIAPYVEEYAPYYFSALTADEYTLKTAITDDGEMGAMYPLLQEPFPVTNGLWIRQDWLDELNMDIPTTPDEMADVLKAFRDEYGADVGFYQMIRPDNTKAGITAEGIWNAFGPTDFYLDENGEVQYGLMQDFYYDYMQFLKDLASDNLFLTSTMTDKTSPELFASGGIGIEGDAPDNVPSYITLLDAEEQAKIKLVPMAALGEPTEYGTRTSYISNDAGGIINISTNCEDPELVIHAFDYLFTEEGAVLSSFGIEGLSFEINAEGNPQFTDLVLNNPDGVPARAAMGYWANPGLPGSMDYTRGQSTWDEVQKSAYDVWESAYTGDSMTLPVDSLTLTEEEQDAISVYRSDMVTYATAWVNDVVFGDVELTDAEIETFRSTMTDTMHIQEMIDIYSAAYERFQARSFG